MLKLVEPTHPKWRTRVEKMFLTSWPINNDDPNISCTDVHHELAYGFELSWLGGICGSYCLISGAECHLNDTNHLQCNDGMYRLYSPGGGGCIKLDRP